MNFFEKIKDEFDTHDYIDWIKHESNKKFVVPTIIIFWILVSTIIYIVSIFNSDWTSLEVTKEKKEITLNSNSSNDNIDKNVDEKSENLEIKNKNTENISIEKEKKKYEIKKEILTRDEIKVIEENYIKDQRITTQEFFWLNIKWSDFFKQEFLTFLSSNEIKNLRMNLKDFLEYHTLSTRYINQRNMLINVFISDKKDIKLIKELKWKNEFIWFIEVPFKWFEIDWLKETNNELKKLNQELWTQIKMIIVWNEDEIKLLYDNNLSYLFDFWWVYENESLEKSQYRIKKINSQLHLNNERNSKSVILVNFSLKDDLEFMKWIRKMRVINHIYFNDYEQYSDILKKTIEERLKTINNKTILNEEKIINSWNLDEEKWNQTWTADNWNIYVPIQEKEIWEDLKKEIERIRNIEDNKEKNLEILKIIDKL